MPSIKKGNQYMQVVTYTGNGSTQTVEVGFKIGLLWIKSRSAATNNKVVDIVRGATKALITNTNDAETTDTNGVTAFTATGFTLGSDSAYNTNGATYIAWCWAAGDTTVANNVGTITSQVCANPDAGFSVVTYTATGANATVGHGLGVAADFIIFKCRSTASNWAVYSKSLGNTGGLYLNGTNAFTVSSGFWNNTSPTSSTFSIGTGGDVNSIGQTFVAYCFAEIDGFSKFGNYAGNGSTNGPFVYTGFRPKWVMIKCFGAAASWVMLDSSRDVYNPETNALLADNSAAEGSGYLVDFLSNGFKVRNTGSGTNSAGTGYIYAAFAENPFNYSTAR